MALVRAARRLARRLCANRLLVAIDRHAPHRRETVDYHGFELVYSAGTSVVGRLREQGAYEPELLERIVAAVAASESKVFVDVGANVGLVSLAVLAAVPGAHVYAFEPGRHQARLLRETIRRNDLASRLDLFDVALADRGGTARFAVHSARHASGDGFVDTGRAGAAHAVTVRTETLDTWWRTHDRPNVDVVKLDVEGAELLVLRGGRELVGACRPVLFLELHPANLAAYPYGPDDVLAELAALGYDSVRAGDETELVATPSR